MLQPIFQPARVLARDHSECRHPLDPGARRARNHPWHHSHVLDICKPVPAHENLGRRLACFSRIPGEEALNPNTSRERPVSAPGQGEPNRCWYLTATPPEIALPPDLDLLVDCSCHRAVPS